MARRGNREILEIREESRHFPKKRIWVRLFRLFRGSRNCLGGDSGRILATLRLCVESSFLSVKSVVLYRRIVQFQQDFCRKGTHRTQRQGLMQFILCDFCVLLRPIPVWLRLRRLGFFLFFCGKGLVPKFSISTNLIDLMILLQPSLNWLFLLIYRANHRKSLSTNNLQLFSCFFNQAQSRLIKVNQG